MGSWMHGCLIAVIASDWLRLIKSRVIAALAVKSCVAAETKACCLSHRVTAEEDIPLCLPAPLSSCLICINNWGVSPEDTWLQNLSTKTLVTLQLAKSEIGFFCRSSDTEDTGADSSFVHFLPTTVILLADGLVLLCVPAAARSSQPDPPQSGRLPSARCWTWLSFCGAEGGKKAFSVFTVHLPWERKNLFELN